MMGEHKAEITRKEFVKTKGIPNISIMKTNAESAQSTFFEMDIYNNPMAYWEGLAILYSAKNDEERSRAKGAFKRSLDIYPNHINTLNDLASLHASLGELKKASELYDQVLKIAPRNRKAAVGQIRVKLGLADVYGSLKAMKMISQKELTEYHLNIDDPVYRRNNTQKMYILDAYKEISVKTLKRFRSINGPRPALKSLHAQLQGKNLDGIWEVWMNWRKKKR
jgi:tetratricopeptide (TPR) repeat protein